MTDKEYIELEKRIEERKRIKAMAEDVEQSKQEAITHRTVENARDNTRIEVAYSGRMPRKQKISGNLFTSIQIINGN